MTTDNATFTAIQNAIVRVGGGRGFYIGDERRPLVITAAHCLPHLPPPHSASKAEERSYADLIGSLDGAEREICTECVFVDPIADVAILGEPDGDRFYDEWEAYNAFFEDRPALTIGTLDHPTQGWLLTLNGEWIEVAVDITKSRTWLSLPSLSRATHDAIARGTSGSPILLGDRRVVGLISAGNMLNPALVQCLPARLLTTVGWNLVELTSSDAATAG